MAVVDQEGMRAGCDRHFKLHNANVLSTLDDGLPACSLSHLCLGLGGQLLEGSTRLAL